MQQRKQHAPSSERNTTPILTVLEERLPRRGRALEIASGSGQHIVAFAASFPDITWQPSDPDADARASTAAWIGESGTSNIHAPLDIDVTAADWHGAMEGPFDVILATNLVHITPWTVTEGLMRGAGRLLPGGGFLYLYGPYRRDGEELVESNQRFEAWLKGMSPDYGIRDLAAIELEGRRNGMRLAEAIEMPANNLSLILRKD